MLGLGEKTGSKFTNGKENGRVEIHQLEIRYMTTCR